MFNTIAIVLVVLAALVTLFGLWRFTDVRRDQVAWNDLLALTDDEPVRRFDPAMVAELPGPARRYFAFTIDEGAPIADAVEVDMHGQIGLGDRDDPQFRPMRARQLLAPPFGFVWQLEAGALSGSDGMVPDRSWTRFWLYRLVPVVRAGGDDHLRSSFGRLAAEAAFWAPASLLPHQGVVWDAIDEDTARATVTRGAREQAVEITVDEQGAPRQVLIQRWTNANPDRLFRLQPFGGTLAGYRDFGGYRLPTRVEGGNLFGTEDYFPFFKVEITDARLIGPGIDEGTMQRTPAAEE